MRWRNALALLLLLAAPASAQVPARCLVNTNPPVWGDNTYQFLSCQTDGKLRTTTSAGGAGGGTFSTFGAAFPADGTAGGFSDGTNMQGARVFDLDTGGGTQYILGVNLRQASGGGSIELGTLTTPLRIDPTGTTTQPISAATLPLPSGAATDRTTAAAPFSTRLSDGAAFYDATKTGQLPAALVGGRLDQNLGAWLGSTAPTVGQKAMTSSVPVAISSDQSAVPVSGTVTANAGTNLNTSALALDATLTGRLPVGSTPADNESNAITTTRLGSYTYVFDGATWDRWTGTVTANAGTNLNTSALLLDATFTGRINTQGQKTMVASTPVVFASDQSALPVSGTVTANQGGAPWTVTGTKSNNAGAPGATNLGTLPGVATVAAPTYVEGNQVALSLDLTGAVRVAGGGGLSVTDSATWTAASSAFTPAGGEYNPAAAPLASGQQGTVAMTAARAFLVNQVDNTGRELGTATPGQPSTPLVVALAPRLPVPVSRLQQTPLAAVAVPWGQAVGTPVRQVVPEGMLSSSGVRPSIFCDKSVSIDTAASGSTQLVALSAGQAIYICGLDWISTSALSVKFVYGTGTNCATGATNLEGAQAIAANGGKVIPVSNAPKWMTPASQALCINLSGATQVSGSVTYAQF